MPDPKNFGPANSSKPIDISKATAIRKKATKVEQIFNEDDIELLELKKRYEILNRTQDSIFETAKQYVKGQDKGLRLLIAIIYNNHYLNMLEDTIGYNIKHMSGLIVGPSGSGKSYTLEVLAKIFGIPYTRIILTNVTSAGYVGGDVDNIILTHIKNSGGDIEKAKRGIIFLDEVCKKVITRPENSSGRDINGRSVQEELLKILEPGEINVGKDNLKFDTHMLTVICGGTFVGIDKSLAEIRKERLEGKRSIGFGDNDSKHSKDEDDEDFKDDYLDKAMSDDLSPEYTKKDLIKFGFIDEFAGRFTFITEFYKLTASVAEEVLFAKNSILQQYLNVFYSRGVDLIVDPIVFHQIAMSIAGSDTGARDIESKVLSVLLPAIRDTEQNYCPGICEINSNLEYSSLFQQRQSDDLKFNIVTDFANRTDLKADA